MNPQPFCTHLHSTFCSTHLRSIQHHQQHTRCYGLSLLELLATIAIATTLLMLSATGLGNAIERQSQRTVLHDLYHLILMTRTLAVREETYYTLCASHDNIHCDETWQDRVIVFRDRNKNEQVDNDDSIYRQLLLPNGIRCLEWYSGRHFLQFKPTGASNGTAGHFRFCDSTNNYLEKKLVVSFQGRTSLKDL